MHYTQYGCCVELSCQNAYVTFSMAFVGYYLLLMLNSVDSLCRMMMPKYLRNAILSTVLICSTMLTVYLVWSLFSRTVGAKCLRYTQYGLIYYWCKCQCLRYTQYGLCVVELLCQNAYAKLSTAVVYHWLSCSANADAIPSIVFVYSCHAKSLCYTY